MHLASTYPLVEQYAENFDVKLIVNTGDETEFGTSYDLSDDLPRPAQRADQEDPDDLAGRQPRLTGARSTRCARSRASPCSAPRPIHATGYQVGAQYVTADGLVIAGVPDPRVYGASGAYGSDKDERDRPAREVRRRHRGQGRPEVDALRHLRHPRTGGRARADQGPARPDPPDQLRAHPRAERRRARCSRARRSTWSRARPAPAGWTRSAPNPPPVEFSIESVAADCQFTKVVRFQLGSTRQRGDRRDVASPSAAELRPERDRVDASTSSRRRSTRRATAAPRSGCRPCAT